MKLSLNKTAEKLIWILTVFILTTYIVFETYTWGRYAFFGASVVIVFLAALLNKGSFAIKIEAFHIFMLLFSGYCFLNSVWAVDSSNPIQMGKTIFQILVCVLMLYVYYQNESSVHKLLQVVMWTGYIVSSYAIWFYGLDNIMDAAGGDRLANDFSNVNTIGLAASIACAIQMHEWLYKRSRWSAVFVVPCVMMIAATQSRKAMFVLLVGVFGVYFLRSRQSRNIMNDILKMVGLLIGAVVAAVLVYSLPIFDGVRERMDSMLAGIFGTGKTDNSTLIRLEMISIGWNAFLENPIGGIGVGCSHFLTAKYLGWSTYLHNNFVELLSGGGAIGFCLYYGMYAYLFLNLLRYRNIDREHFEICFVWLALMLVMDYGMVSYYSKAQWFYLMVHFLNIEYCKRKLSLECKPN